MDNKLSQERVTETNTLFSSANIFLSKENIDKLAVLNAVDVLPNQHQINANARLPPWLEIDKLVTHGIPMGVHVDYGLSADAGSM